jgi:hypothetical protein
LTNEYEELQIKIRPWVERKFELGLPVWMMPFVLERFSGTPARLREKLMANESILRIRPTDGKWSILEHAGHLWQIERLTLRRFEEFAAGDPTMTGADMSNRSTWDGDYNNKLAKEIIDGYAAARKSVVDFVLGQPEQFFTKSAVHPRLNLAMTPVDYIYFMSEHDDQHLAVISEMIRTLPH